MSSMEAAIRFSTVAATMLGMTASPGVVATEALAVVIVESMIICTENVKIQVVAVVLVVVVPVDLGHSAHVAVVGLITRRNVINPNKKISNI